MWRRLSAGCWQAADLHLVKESCICLGSIVRSDSGLAHHSRAPSTMQCSPISVSLAVGLSHHRLVILSLDKTCNADHTAEWKMHFEFQELDPRGLMVPVVKLDVDINKQDHAAVAATASNGLDAGQRAQAAVAADTAKAVAAGEATTADLVQDAAAIIPARASNKQS